MATGTRLWWGITVEEECKKKKTLSTAGFEPGPNGWNAVTLTIRLTGTVGRKGGNKFIIADWLQR